MSALGLLLGGVRYTGNTKGDHKEYKGILQAFVLIFLNLFHFFWDRVFQSLRTVSGRKGFYFYLCANNIIEAQREEKG